MFKKNFKYLFEGILEWIFKFLIRLSFIDDERVVELVCELVDLIGDWLGL